MGGPDHTLGPSLLVTVEEAADLLRLGRTHMYELVMSGHIASVKLGRRRLIPRKSLEEFVEGLMANQVRA